ncbi:MAG TPA: hypothetical protein ENN28_01315 [Candidatus Uhrbacteria bacterium]|nr:hypothetical protein [Candidatus Uhrbacteria bacterium]
MLPPQHAAKSFAKIYEQTPRFFLKDWPVIFKLIWELHCWFDRFANTKGYNTPGTLWYHREQTHHWEGIDEAVRIFTCKYGLKFMIIIEQEAKQHVLDDFGEIPSKSHVTRYYLRQKRGW